MPVELGANVAIIRCQQILLTKRDDVHAWTLPGGGVGQDESISEAAVREAREETGLEIELTRLVGIYSLPTWGWGGHHSVVFAARPIGGRIRPQQGEVVEAAYFDATALPEPLVWWQQQRILDALSGVGGSVAWSQKPDWPFEGVTTRQDFYHLVAESGVSKQEFFLRHLSKPEGDAESIEVLEVGEAHSRT